MGLVGSRSVLGLGRQSWDFNNKFYFEPNPQGPKAKNVFNDIMLSDVRDFNAHIISVEMFDMTLDNIESWRAETYAIAPGRPKTYQLTIKFRDSDQNYYYKTFIRALYALNNQYPADQYVDFKIYNEPCWVNQKARVLYDVKNCILTTVGGLTYDAASRNQITEFTTTWMCPKLDF